MGPNDKKTLIINAAENLFAVKGFSGTSVRDIAHEAGINIAMISYYFGSKEKLMEAVFEQRTAHLRFQVEALLKNEELSPLQKVNMVIDDYIDRVLERQQFHQIMIREQMAEKNNVIAGIIYETKKRNLEVIRKLIQEGQKKNVFKKNIDVILMVNTMIGTVMQVVTTQSYYREMNNLQHLSEADFRHHLKKKLSHHLKMLFKAILTYEI